MRTYPALRKPLSLAGIGRASDSALTPEQVQANARRLVVEIAWYGILVGTTINLMQVYVVRLGASSLLVGGVTYGPALVSVFWQIPAAQWMRRRGHRMQWVLGSGFLHRAGYLLVALLPFFVQDNLAQATVVALVLAAFATTLSATSFLSMMADALPPDEVPGVVSRRLAAFGFSSTLSTLLASFLLARLPFPFNYQVVFLIGFAASMLSQWNVAQIRVPDRLPVRARGSRGLGEFLRIGRRPRFMQYVAVVGVMQTAIGMVVPLLPLFAVRQLGATDAQVSLVVMMFSGSSVLGSLWMRRVVRRAGRARVLTVGAIGYTVYPLLISISLGVGWLIVWAIIGGFFYAAITVTLFDNLLGVTPDGDKTNYVAVYNLFVNAALFLGPLAAALLVRGPAGPSLALRIAAGISLLSGVLCWLWMRAVRRDALAVVPSTLAQPEHAVAES